MKRYNVLYITIAVGILTVIALGAYDKDIPAATTSLRSSNPQILANQAAIEAALNREHEFSTDGTVADQAHHKKGSARAYFQDAEPTTRSDTTAFTSEDLGSLWFDTDATPDNQYYVLTVIDRTWTPVSDEIIATMLASARVFTSTLGVTGDFAVNTNKFTVTAASGNTLVAGTLDVTGIATLGDASKLTSSAAPTLNRSIANKKYVDDQITAITDTSYSGGESHTFIGGLIIKMGEESVAGNATDEITYGDAFSNAVVSAVCSYKSTNAGLTESAACTPKSGSETSILQVTNGMNATQTVSWFVIGY